jgi:hypothetical protein
LAGARHFLGLLRVLDDKVFRDLHTNQPHMHQYMMS